MESLNGLSSATAKSIRACEISKGLVATALTTMFSGITVAGDMVPTIVFDWIVMLRSDGLPTCTRDDLILAHKFVTVLVSIKEHQITS